VTRQDIRKSVAALLKNRTAAGDRVVSMRPTQWWRPNLPSLAVYSLSESVSESSISPREYRRELRLAIQATVQENRNPANGAILETVDDVIDAIAAEVEAVILPNPTLGGTASDSTLSEVVIKVADEGEVPFAAIFWTLTATYFEKVPEVDAATLPPARLVVTSYDLDPPDGNLEAQDRTTLEAP
jgi:hypothetical protein